jgi:DNA-binding transcriptional regulator YiaG
MPDKTRPSDQAQLPGGKTDWAAVDAMTDEAAEAAALSDPDCQPLGDAQSLHPMAQVKRLRLRLKLGQQAFADLYHIPLSTLVAWERHEAMPDAVAIAFLNAIAADPEGLADALSKSPEYSSAAE